MNKGFILIHRKIQNNEFYFAERFTKMGAWIDLIMIASHNGNTYYLRGINIALKPSEIGYSIRTLARRWKWNERTVMKYLRMLETRKMIEIKKSNLINIIKITKYTEFQRPFQNKSKTRKNTTQKKQVSKGTLTTIEGDNTTQSTTQNTTQNTTKEIMNKECILLPDTKNRDLNLLSEKERKMLNPAFETVLWRDVTASNLAYMRGALKYESADFSFISGMLKLKPDNIPERQKYIILNIVLDKHKEKISSEGMGKEVKGYIGNEFKNYFISDYKKIYNANNRKSQVQEMEVF
jgi:DNA-binding transcriptional regulator YhcF (GntR family)